MFCPFCKAEYRAAFRKCSDCSISLVESVSRHASDANFMVMLWNGESLPFLESVCAQLDQAAIPVATPHVDVLLRNPADRYHLRHLKTFPYVLGVFKSDFVTARKILESVANHSPTPISLPPVAAYPEPFDEKQKVDFGPQSQDLFDATTVLSSSADLNRIVFLETCLNGPDIPFRRIALEDGTYKVQVRQRDESAARQVLDEIARGISSQAAEANQEDVLLRDEPPQSYFLAWLLPLAYMLLWMFWFAPDYQNTDSIGLSLRAMLFSFAGVASWVGMFWMMYQANRYEVRPFRYCVAAIIPLTFVWYYVERYSVRKGEQRLPISARVRSGPPAAS